MIEVCSWCKCESFLVQTFTRLNGRHGAFLSGSNIRVETSADHPDERPALLRDPDDFVVIRCSQGSTTHLNGKHGAFLSDPNMRVETSADYPDERPALLRDPDNFVVQLDQPIGLQRGESGHFLGEDAGIAAEALADFAEIDLKVAHQTLDNCRAKPILVVQD